MALLSSWHFSYAQWTLAAFCGILVGLSKTGLVGSMFLVIPIMAGMFGALESTGVVLPMLVLADIVAVIYYNRHANWKHLARLMPFALVGILVALAIGKLVSKTAFEVLFSVTILLVIALMIWRELQKKQMTIPKGMWFPTGMGFVSGFATMIGNAAGPTMYLYLLSMKLPKDVFIGTGAWFYFMVNVIKIPLQALIWKTITPATLAFNLVTVPFIFLGIWIGIAAVKRIPEKAFRALVMASVLVAALLMVVNLI